MSVAFVGKDCVSLQARVQGTNWTLGLYRGPGRNHPGPGTCDT